MKIKKLKYKLNPLKIDNLKEGRDRALEQFQKICAAESLTLLAVTMQVDYTPVKVPGNPDLGTKPSMVNMFVYSCLAKEEEDNDPRRNRRLSK